MGYYTDFTLVTKNPEMYEPIKKRLQEVSGYNDLFTDEADDIKWYDYRNTCQKVSAEFPNERFVVQGEGEDRFDVWQEEFYNGIAGHYWRLNVPEVPLPWD